jgi:sterol desaturase/sphingolipid hydroxylase (fatty acid hydroxylase superfamily)
MLNQPNTRDRELKTSRFTKLFESLGVINGKHFDENGFIIYRGFWWKLALPQVILAAHLSVVAGVSVWASNRSTLAWKVIPAGLVPGWLIWTLFEYIFHRWLLHHTRYRLLRKIFWQGLHREHHTYRQMQDPDHHGIHIAISLPVILAVVAAVAASTDGGFGLAIAAGWILGYSSYEALHWLFHSGESATGAAWAGLFRSLWDAHTVHHLRRADTNYGFVTMFWDRRFGTFLTAPQQVETTSSLPRFNL